MAYRTEKNGEDTDIVIDGWEEGIAPSPHKGIANIQNGNISTELGEITASFARARNDVQVPITGGTLTASTGDGTSLLAAPSNLYAGQQINITSTNITTTATSATVNYLVIGGGGGGGAGAAGIAAGGGGAGGYIESSAFIKPTSYTITVGAGGAGSTNGASVVGATGSNSSFMGPSGTINAIAAGGGGGASGGVINGVAGASGGGATSNGAGGTGTVGQGNNGATGTNATFVGSGGGGAISAGVAATSTSTGGAGGAGTASSISGSSVTRAGGGGGGGANATGAGGAGGTGGGGAGGTTGGVGASATANTGGGGGGGAANNVGGAGGSGVIIISYTTGSLTATGGTITTSGGNTIHTFNSSGTFTVTAINTVITLPLGNYYVSYKDTSNKIKLSYYYDPYAQNVIIHSTTGTATFNTVAVVGNPLSKAIESYTTATSAETRYYILDSAGYVWLYDTAVYANSLSTTGIGITWALPDPTDYSTNLFNSIGVLNGWLFALSNTTILGKPTVNLGLSFQSTGMGMENPFPTHTNFALTGHQGRMYYCDGNYIGSVFPDTSIESGTGNVQSYAQYTASTITGTITKLLTGSIPTSASTVAVRIPAVFFTDRYGLTPNSITADTVYYITNGVGSKTFSVYTSLTGGSPIDMQTGAVGNQYFNTFYPLGTHASFSGDHPLMTFTGQRVNLPTFEISQSLVEIGSTVLIGCAGSVVYPWDQSSVTPSGIINLPERNTVQMVTVNQMAYVFAGNNGNIYITDGSTASLVLSLPDYLAGVPGSPGTYIESTYAWGGAAYVRGRVYFSVLDQLTAKVGNCGGVWSFVPTQNLYIGQDTGMALRLEAQNSYGTYNGVASLIIPSEIQNSQVPLYWTAWNSDINTPTYGIDTSTNGTSASSVVVIETDAIPVGTMLNKRTLEQIEYKLGAPLDVGATVTAKYRQNITDAWTACNAFLTETSGLSGYAPVNFEKGQWLQLQFTLTPITSSAFTNTFIRFREIRIR